AEDDPTRGELTVPDPAVEARVIGSSDLPLGQAVKARLAKADLEARSVEFELE
ncbi:MAG: RNB domain-containing ribonuclease, partial [Nocardioides sp.]